MAGRDAAGRALRGLVIGAGLLALVGGTVALMMQLGWRPDVRRAREELERATGESVEALKARHRTRDRATAEAWVLERAAARLGIVLAAPGRDPAQFVPMVPGDRALAVRRDALVAWLRGELQQPDEDTAPPPAGAAEEIEAMQAGLDAAAGALSHARFVAWEQSLTPDGLWSGSPGLLRLGRVLLADALERQRTGRDGAEARLEAAWRCVELLRSRPEVIPQLVGVALAGEVAAIARRGPPLGPDWDARLDVLPFTAALADAHVTDAAACLDTATAPRDRLLRESGAELPTVTRLLGGASLRRALAARARNDVLIVAALGDPARCGQGTLPVLEKPRGGAALLPNDTGDTGAIVRIDRLRLVFELTRRVWELKATRASDPAGAWPEELPGGSASACSVVRWDYARPRAGIASLKASSWEGEWWQVNAKVPPMAWESPTPQPSP